ncbi:MAG TPA: Coq4 family protein [Candidatus Margulisiibacteriota bacterium]|nr:Coq4 family protein [Candidatus Margulisiibacteriota bacterium]
MSALAKAPNSKPTLHPVFVQNMVRTFNDSDEHGVHLLFNEWWPHAPDFTIERYLENFRATPGVEAFLAERYLADPITLDVLGALPAGSVGRGYHEFLTKNKLEKNLATNYKLLHDAVAAGGQLDRMPADMKYAVIRGFQIHDILHVITGYTPSGLHELSLQAFCLAQLQFPYFSMWMATTTSRMTFLQPDSIVPVMDAITQGWRYGRRVKNLQFEKWESMFEEPVALVRLRYGIAPGGMEDA